MGNKLSSCNVVLFLGHPNLATKLTKDHSVLEPHWTKRSWKHCFSSVTICQVTFLHYGGSGGGVMIPKLLMNPW